MKFKIGLIHATINSVAPINDAFQHYTPETKLLHFLDDGLIEEVNRQGGVTPKTLRRFVELVQKAEESGVDGILINCSVFTPYVPQISYLFEVPVISADYSMLRKSVEIGKCIGLIATVDAAALTSEKIIMDISGEQGKKVSVRTEVIPEAFEALNKGDFNEHDSLIHEKVKALSSECDVIVLAQISMTRAARSMQNHPKPILTSPEISVKSIISNIQDQNSLHRE